MDKFNEWLKKEHNIIYGESSGNYYFIVDQGENNLFRAYLNENMMIGHKIEFICDNGDFSFMELKIIALNTINNLDRTLNKMIEDLSI